jgi:hypothetical protein
MRTRLTTTAIAVGVALALATSATADPPPTAPGAVNCFGLATAHLASGAATNDLTHGIGGFAHLANVHVRAILQLQRDFCAGLL